MSCTQLHFKVLDHDPLIQPLKEIVLNPTFCAVLYIYFHLRGVEVTHNKNRIHTACSASECLVYLEVFKLFEGCSLYMHKTTLLHLFLLTAKAHK